MLHQRVDGAFGRRIGRNRAGGSAGRERGDKNDAAALHHDRKQLLHQKEWRADIDREQRVEIRNRGVFDGRGLGDPGIGDQNVEPLADNTAGLFGELVRAVRRGEIGSDRLGAAARQADFGNDAVGFLGAAA